MRIIVRNLCRSPCPESISRLIQPQARTNAKKFPREIRNVQTVYVGEYFPADHNFWRTICRLTAIIIRMGRDSQGVRSLTNKRSRDNI